MKRLLTLAIFIGAMVPIVWSVCGNWTWVPSHWDNCTSEWDCNMSGCSAGETVSTNYVCAEQGTGSPPDYCCECKQVTKECTGNGNRCQGYRYERTRRSEENKSCSRVNPGNPNSEWWCGPHGGGGENG